MNTMIFSRKAYHGNTKQEKEFGKNVLETANHASNKENHIELMQELYPAHMIEMLYTYKHSGMALERSPSCRWDSSMDGMVAYKDDEQLNQRILEINEEL